MKKTTLLLLLLLCCSVCLFANVFRVNNNLPTDKSQKIYKTVKETNDDPTVLGGDTLMIEGSATVYPGVTLTKRFVLIGPGYLLAQNPQTQANSLQAVMSDITLKNQASGSVLLGLTFANGYYGNTPWIEANNIIIMRCFLPNSIQITGNVNNIAVIQNYFVGSAITAGYYGYTFTDLLFRNNYVGDPVDLPSSDSYQRVFSAIDNNIFAGNLTVTTSTFRSNVILSTATSLNITSVNIQNNLISSNQLPTTNGNQIYDPANLFVGATGNSQDGQYKIRTGSPYKTAGYNNTEPGIYGGSQPYVLSGIPPIPSIYEFTADEFASKQTGLQINIKVKANQ